MSGNGGRFMQSSKQRAVIIGGSSGMGLATARKLLDEGMHVTIVGRGEDRLRQAAEKLHSEHLETEPLDISDQTAVVAYFSKAKQFHHLILSVGVSVNCMGNFKDVDLSLIAQGIQNKVIWQLIVLQAALPKMYDDGSVTFITAESARHAAPGASGPSAINGALEATIPTLARELGPIRVNGVSPGLIDTPRWHNLPEEQRNKLFNEFATSLPVGHIGDADDVATCIVMLTRNRYISGSIIECDGGAHTL